MIGAAVDDGMEGWGRDDESVDLGNDEEGVGDVQARERTRQKVRREGRGGADGLSTWLGLQATRIRKQASWEVPRGDESP